MSRDTAADPIAHLEDLVERFDHVSAAVWDIDGALPMVEVMGGRYRNGGDSARGGFRFAQFRLPGGAKLELIQPLDGAGPDHFLVRFLRSRGEGIHHLTFKVLDLHRAVARARDLGFDVVGVDDSDPGWKEAFVHPRSAHGVLIQLAEWEDGPEPGDAAVADLPTGDAP